MKIQIDTVAKVIKLEQSAKITELLDVIKKLFPDNEWKNYTLETNTVINNWNSPIYIDRWYYPSYPIITYLGTGTGTLTLNGGCSTVTTDNVNGISATSGTYCIETN